MARNVSVAAMQGALAQQTDEVYLILLEVDHPNLGAPLRFVNNDANVTSGGNVYTAFPFEVTMPDDKEGKEPQAEIKVDNVSRELIDEVRTLTSPPSMTLSVILLSSPNTIEWGPLDLETQGVTYDAYSITFNLGYSAFIAEPFPYRKFNSVDFPGMFS